MTSAGIMSAEKSESTLIEPCKCGTKYEASNVKNYECEVLTAVTVGCKGGAMAVINTVGCGIDTTPGGNFEPTVV